MNRYRMDIIETRTSFVMVEASDDREAEVLAMEGQGEIAEPYPPELRSVKVTPVNE